MAQLNEIEKLGLTEKVIKLSSTKSAREIKDILKTEDNATISHVTISKYIREIRQERQEATKAVIAETVTPGLTSDLAFFDEMLLTYRTRFKECDELGLAGIKAALEIGKEYRATVETKVKIAGGNGVDEPIAVKQFVTVSPDDWDLPDGDSGTSKTTKV